MQPNKLALLLATSALLALSACASQRPMAASAVPPARPLDANQAVLTANWTNPTIVTLGLTEGAVAPDELAFLVGEPVQLQIRNTGTRDTVFRAPAFFRAVAVRTVAEAMVEAPFRPMGFNAKRMEQIAFEGVPQLLRLTPHEQEVARTSRNPFDAAPAPATPIDFGDLLGGLGANPFGAGAAAAQADAAAAPATAAPTNPFDVLGALGAAAPAPPPPPATPQPTPVAPAETAAQAAAAAGLTVQAGVEEAHEQTLLKEWGAGKLVGLESIALKAGEAVYITFVPLTPGTYGFSAQGGRSLVGGMRGRVHILSADQATLAPEVAAPAADVQLYRAETKAP